MTTITADWQSAVALACVAVAVAYLVRRLIGALKAPHRSSCAGCPAPPTTGIQHKPLVTLESVARSSKPSESHGESNRA